MSNENASYTKIYSSQNQLSSFTTLIGYTPTIFTTLAANNAATVPLMTSSNQVVATDINDTRLLVLPARSVVTRVVISDGGVTITPETNTFAISFLPKNTANVLTNATALAPAASGMLVGSNAVGSGISGTNAAIGAVAIYSAALAANTPNTGPVIQPLNSGGIGSIYPYVVSDSFVVVYNTSATANTAGQLKVQISYSTINL
jgi:hypothetical protein